MRQLNAHTAELRSELVGPAQHHKTCRRADGDQKKRHGSAAAPAKTDDDLSENENYCRSKTES
jgi:hypothetical protein